ncbi:hypothetical protein VHUM_02300 [Vanrija humicola]|uniref:Transcription factor CBF/NF-Y/archaeal histone domain-containing protein n=1 Tax=Vanrija humicola TaxID=5417 RepID=A0A7D8YZA7_VANHU|nr:hypothetical protein VHUM_02300 [Vanrija humicola]
MQMDEEVGKLASATPVMISKSLECFLQLLIDETAKETRERGSRKMVPYHLKAMIDKSDQFDFLRELVEGVPDPGEKAGPAKRKASTAGGDGVAATPRRKSAAAKVAEAKKEDVPPPGSLPAIGTWKRDASGEGGTGEGGKGMFDDYDDDYDDY